VKVDAARQPAHTRAVFEVAPAERLPAVARLLAHFRPESTLAFCNTPAVPRPGGAAAGPGFDALALHGELEQRERDQVLVQFANRSCSVLVATDVAARGLDITQLAAVINVDISPDPEVHVHRIGRTGRAGEAGLALSLAPWTTWAASAASSSSPGSRRSGRAWTRSRQRRGAPARP
jgi:ATP-independent RNA helicase DbpA